MFKKLAFGSLLILVLAVGGYSIVAAQGPQPPTGGGWMGRPPMGGQPQGGPGFNPRGAVREMLPPMLDDVAETLGMSEADLRSALSSGQTLAQIAEAQGVSQDDLIAALLQEPQEHLQQAVSDGHLTQAQADERLAQIKERVSQWLESDGRPPMGGRPQSHRGHFGGRGATKLFHPRFGGKR